MNGRLDRLTEAQRDVLRRFHVRKNAKQIGRELGITHWAVNERLRAARRALDVATSSEAAAMLAAHEASAPYNRVVCDPPGLAEPAHQALFSEPDKGSEQEPAAAILQLRENAPAFLHQPLGRIGIPVPRYRGDINDLTLRVRLIWIGALAAGIVLLVGALVTIAWGVVRISTQLF